MMDASNKCVKSSITLYGRTSINITLSEALINCAAVLSNSDRGIALLYSPTSCQFAKIENGGTLSDVNNKTVDLKDILK